MSPPYLISHYVFKEQDGFANLHPAVQGVSLLYAPGRNPKKRGEGVRREDGAKGGQGRHASNLRQRRVNVRVPVDGPVEVVRVQFGQGVMQSPLVKIGQELVERGGAGVPRVSIQGGRTKGIAEIGVSGPLRCFEIQFLGQEVVACRLDHLAEAGNLRICRMLWALPPVIYVEVAYRLPAVYAISVFETAFESCNLSILLGDGCGVVVEHDKDTVVIRYTAIIVKVISLDAHLSPSFFIGVTV